MRARNRLRMRGAGRPLAETPQQITGLAAWFDARTTAYITIGTGVSAWVARQTDADMGAVALTQGTGANQPAYSASDADFGGKGCISFDGSNDQLTGNNAASKWAFMHNGTGATIFWVRRIDSTGPASQYILQTGIVATHVGFNMLYHTTSQGQVVICNGSGTFANGNSHANQGIRDQTAWQSMSYENDSRILRRTGQANTQADTVGQDPSASNPQNALAIGSAGALFKGKIAEIAVYRRVLSAAEVAQLAAYANVQYGVAV